VKRIQSEGGDIYVGNVITECDSGYVVMDNYCVWYYGDSEPYDSRHPDDSVSFISKCELPL
jgi:hypothetical protein